MLWLFDQKMKECLPTNSPLCSGIRHFNEIFKDSMCASMRTVCGLLQERHEFVSGTTLFLTMSYSIGKNRYLRVFSICVFFLCVCVCDFSRWVKTLTQPPQFTWIYGPLRAKPWYLGCFVSIMSVKAQGCLQLPKPTSWKAGICSVSTESMVKIR